MKKIISFSLLFMLIGLTGSGCSSDDDSSNNSTIAYPIEGTWKLISRTVTNTQTGSVDNYLQCETLDLHIFKPATGTTNRGIYEYVPYSLVSGQGCVMQPTQYYEWSPSLTINNVYTVFYDNEGSLFNVVFSNNNTRMTQTVIENYYITEVVYQKQ